MAEVQSRIAARRAAEPVLDREGLRRAGVLVPLFVREGKLWILLTRCTESVEHHRGQISFPGGSEEETDGSLTRQCGKGGSRGRSRRRDPARFACRS
jgi:hypothetical protein